jgi:HKD family nuclease
MIRSGQAKVSTDVELYRVNNSIRGPQDSLYKYLRASIAEAIRIRFLVAFITESGARLVAKPLREAVDRGVPITILTGTYLCNTEPYALEYLIEKVGPTLELRVYAETGRSFHPKAYFFDRPNDSEVFISSANLSWTALTTGVEWSYRLRRSLAPNDYQQFDEEYQRLLANYSLPVTKEFMREYWREWREKNSNGLFCKKKVAHEYLTHTSRPANIDRAGNL